MAQTTFTVNSTEDNSNETVGNGDCDTGETIDINGDSLIECTFRAALEEVNAGSGEFEIEFSDNIDTDANGRSIVEGVEEPLPEVNSQLTVAGETHPEFDGQHPKFALIAQADESTNDGLRITSGADNSSIRHIGIGLFENSGIVVANVSNVELEGVESGYSVGLFSFGNSDHGIVIGSSAENTVVTESTIIWNDGWGIRVTGAATGTRITDNHIGIKDDNGDYDILGNEDGGVLIHPNASDDNRVGNCYQLIGTATCDGNTISGNDGPGVDVQSDNQRVVANNIGTDPDGNGGEDFANEGNGIDVSSSNNTIGQSFIGGVIGSSVPGQNVVGNNTYGVLVNGSGNTIHNNYLGTNEDFDDVGNQLNGILISSGADNHITDNEIRFNDDDGVNLSSDSNQGDITGNRIKSNEESGIHIVNGAAEIGSTDDPNIIGNNDDHGISVRGSIDDVKILGNYIGTNEEGDNLGNDRNGINVGSGISSTSANSVEIGNTASINDDSDDAANVIGFNQSGVRLIYTNDQTIQGNYIGTNADGEDLGNNAHGVYIGDLNPAQGNVVGYSAGDVVPDNTHPSEGSRANVISNNSDAVNLFENDGENKIENPVRGNIISGNEDGINLGDEGDEIDPGGGEEGPNNLQNFPEFDEDETVYNDTDDEIIANFRVRTNTGNAAYPLEIDFYKVDGDEQQGKTYLGTVDYSDANDWVFETIDLPDHVDLSSGEHIVATATDGDGNTSQFSEVVAVQEEVPEIAVSEDELDFNTVIEGESETRTFDIENTGDDDLDGEVSLEEDGGGVFDITGGDGSFSLSPNDDMEVEVEFTPDDVDDFAGRIDVEHNADNEPDPFEVDLEGEGQPDIPAPDAVSLSSPEDEAENVVVSPDFEWLEAEYADEYLLQVAEDSDFDEYQIDESVTDTTYTPDSELDYYQTYYWRVRASNDSGDGEWSESWSFTTEPNIEPFALESPADESEVTVDGTPDDEFLIEWEYPESVVEDELTFVWILSEDGSFDNPELEIQSDNDGEDTTLTLTYQELDDFLDSNGISEGEEFEGQWTVRAEYEQTDQEAEEPFEVTLVRGEVTSSQEIGEVPDDFTLKQNYPNPFNPSTQIRFELPEDAEVTLRVYNSVGREVTTLIDESKSAGSYEVTFNANDLSSGNYIYRLEANDQILTRTMTFVK